MANSWRLVPRGAASTPHKTQIIRESAQAAKRQRPSKQILSTDWESCSMGAFHDFQIFQPMHDTRMHAVFGFRAIPQDCCNACPLCPLVAAYSVNNLLETLQCSQWPGRADIQGYCWSQEDFVSNNLTHRPIMHDNARQRNTGNGYRALHQPRELRHQAAQPLA